MSKHLEYKQPLQGEVYPPKGRPQGTYTKLERTMGMLGNEKVSVLQSVRPGKNLPNLTELYPLLVQQKSSRATANP